MLVALRMWCWNKRAQTRPPVQRAVMRAQQAVMRAQQAVMRAQRPVMRARRLTPLLVALLTTLVCGAEAQAQEGFRAREGVNGDGADTHLFRPAVDSKGFFSVNGSRILGAGDVSFGL